MEIPIAFDVEAARKVVLATPWGKLAPTLLAACDEIERLTMELDTESAEIERLREVLREIAYDGPNPGSRRTVELQWASDIARAALESTAAQSSWTRATVAEAEVEAEQLRETLRGCRKLFVELRGDWSDNRGPCREGLALIDAALKVKP